MKKNRIILGIGHPWFTENITHISLLKNNGYGGTIMFKIKDLGSYNKIRLVAEVIK